MVFFNEKKNWERFGWFLTEKYEFEGQILALCDSSPLIQNSKFNDFLWVCWFLGKNLSNFVSPVWKLHNPYCHNVYPHIKCLKGVLLWGDEKYGATSKLNLAPLIFWDAGMKYFWPSPRILLIVCSKVNTVHASF